MPAPRKPVKIQKDEDTKRLNFTKEEQKELDGLKKEEAEKFIIRKKVAENRYLDKADQHEISHEDEVLAGLVPA